MAGACLPSAEILLSKRVQELALDPLLELPPHLFICRQGEDDEAHLTKGFSSPESARNIIPVIDLGVINTKPANGEQEKRKEEELLKLRSALSSWGCFQAIGHGISRSLLDGIRGVAREFFEQPMEEKKKVAKGVAEFEGYGADPTPAVGQPIDWSDRLFLEVYPHDRRRLDLWPENPISFRETLEEYMVKIKEMTETVSRSIAMSLELPENCFLNQFGEGAQLQARFNYYSSCRWPDRVLGLKPHSDGSGYTIILQGVGVEGLQVQRQGDGSWVTVPSIPEALLVLMGDQMEIMTNGEFKSPVHRVLANADRVRISIAVFYTPDPNLEIGPEDGLVDEDRPLAYKRMKDYANAHYKLYQQGIRAIHISKV